MGKEVRFEPYEPHEIINVPDDRHKLTPKQVATAREWFKDVRGCMICGSRFNDLCRPHIDHCHVTGVIRGKLCYRCNVGLGYFKENIDIMKSALRYMETFKYNPDMVEPDLWSNE